MDIMFFANLRNGVTSFRIVMEGQVFFRIQVQAIEQAVIASTQRLNPGTMICFTCLLRWGDCSKSCNS